MMEKQHYSRRSFLRNTFSSGMLLLTGGLLAAGCGDGKKENKAEEELTSCQDYSHLAEEDLAARKKLGYTDTSPDPEKYCRLCNLYKPPKEGAKCGGCLLFKGPVEAEGTCTYWAPQT